MNCVTCDIDVGDAPLVVIDSEIATLGFCSSVCRDRWEEWVAEAGTWPIVRSDDDDD